jgi:hypothetical protein
MRYTAESKGSDDTTSHECCRWGHWWYDEESANQWISEFVTSYQIF